MKKLSLIVSISLLTLAVSCGPGKTGGNSPAPKAPPVIDLPEDSVLANWTNSNPSSVLASLDLSNLTIGSEQPAQDVIDCNGHLGNSGLVNGVNQDSVLATGNEEAGTIQFGHTAYVGASNLACRSLSKESYTYSVSGDTLTLCNVNCLNGVYPSCQSPALACSTFTKN
jgi:hypothetical protein